MLGVGNIGRLSVGSVLRTVAAVVVATGNWILASGIWTDSGVWDDAATWVD